MLLFQRPDQIIQTLFAIEQFGGTHIHAHTYIHTKILPRKFCRVDPERQSVQGRRVLQVMTNTQESKEQKQRGDMCSGSTYFVTNTQNGFTQNGGRDLAPWQAAFVFQDRSSQGSHMASNQVQYITTYLHASLTCTYTCSQVVVPNHVSLTCTSWASFFGYNFDIFQARPHTFLLSQLRKVPEY